MRSWWFILIWAAMIILAMGLIRLVSRDPLRSRRPSLARPRFRRSDYVLLTALMALPLGYAIFTFLSGHLLSYRNLLYPAIVLTHWQRSVRTMSRAGVNSQLHRTLVTVLAIPLSWLGAYGFALSLVIFGAVMYAAGFEALSNEWFTRAIFMGAIVIAFGLVLVAVRKYIAWVYRNRGVITDEVR